VGASLRAHLLCLWFSWACTDPKPQHHVETAEPERSFIPVSSVPASLLVGPDSRDALFSAVSTDEALVVSARDAHGWPYWIEAWDGAAWARVGSVTGGSIWRGDPVPSGTPLRAIRAADLTPTPSFEARAVEAAWDALDDTPALLEGDALSPQLRLTELPGPGIGPVALRVSLSTPDQSAWLAEDCSDEDCWAEEETRWRDSPDLAALDENQHPELIIPALELADATLRAELVLRLDSGWLTLASAETSVTVLGGRWRWGDPHVHSRWSNDGCEEPDSDCGPRGDLPAEDFFESASDEALDFAALTDHAEWESYLPDGADGATLPVWDGQAGAVADAVGGDVLPILGFEWTHTSVATEDDHARGSHRTVLLSDPSACESYRVAGAYSSDPWLPERGSWYFETANENFADSVATLWTTLDAAADTCGSAVRWLSFAHHSAYEKPQPTDWTLSENRPDRETLIEVYSEHGSSECADTDADGCDFGYNRRQGYYPDGSVMTALDQGFQLGFVASTDAHDGHPGSLEDGPSAVAWWTDTDGDGVDDAVSSQFGAGGLTGVLVGGSLGADALFDAMEARETAATTGPRPPLHAYARGSSGALYAVGATLPVTDEPFTLSLSLDARVDERTGAHLTQIDRLETGGVLTDTVADSLSYQATWSPSAGDWTYLRLRYADEEGEESRVWLSPWFAE